ncbi:MULTISPECIES: M48 family metallopeptidase [unclassified Streptomyces]|uniref:M48 family metallopeptidase n=1 Tax=unclassified Streptomyces TaxID=2593676 RepID=UPI0035DB1A84
MSHRLRLACAALLLLSFYAGVGLSVLAWAALIVMVFVSTGAEGATTFPAPGFLFFAGTAPLVYALLDAVRRSLFLTGTQEAQGVATSPREAAALHALVDELTRRFGIREPVHIRLTRQACAEMSDEDTRYLGLADGNHVLSVGLPLLAALPRDQVRMILAHECAHLSLRHHRVRAFTVRLELSLTVARDSLQRFGGANGLVATYTAFPRALTGAYIRLFRWIVQPVRRRQELEADAAAAAACGAPLLAEALVGQAMTERLWGHFQQVFLEAAPAGVLPTDPFKGFGAALSNPGIRDRLPALRTEVVTVSAVDTEFGSSHPGLGERIRRLLGSATLAPQSSFRPDPALLPGLPSGDIARLLPLYASTRKATLPWKQWLARWADQHDAHLTTSLLDAVRSLSPRGRRITLRHVLLMLDSGERMTLARAVEARLSKTGHDSEPLDLLARALLVLVRSRLGEHTVRRPLLRDLVTDAVRQPAHTSRLSLYLASLGVDEDEPLDSDAQLTYTMRTMSRKLPEKGGELVRTLRRATLTILVVGLTAGGCYWNMRPAPKQQHTVVVPDRRSGTSTDSPTLPGPGFVAPSYPSYPSYPSDPLADPFAPYRDPRPVITVPPQPAPAITSLLDPAAR